MINFADNPHRNFAIEAMSNSLYYHPKLESSSTSPYPCQKHLWSPETAAYTSPVSTSCVTDDATDLKHKLLELETAMLGPESDLIDSYEIEMIAQRDLKCVLIACAKSVSDDDPLMSQWLIDELRKMVSVSGEPIQRIGAYMLEGLVARLASSGTSICRTNARFEHVLYEVCPYIKFGYMSANGAIAEAMKDEERVHIIDFRIGGGAQWVTLIQAFAGRPAGPPRIRITVVDDVGASGPPGRRLSRLAEALGVPFEFNTVVDPAGLRTRPGEALAVNFAFTLHHVPDESVSVENHRDRLLRVVKSLDPKVVTLVEQECNTNSAAFFPRFVETLDYYTAMFESIDVALPRAHKDRINVEQHCLARDIVNLIACEGAERVERQEPLGKWRSRFLMAGFKPYPLSTLVNTTIDTLLRNYCDHYTLEVKDDALYLGWRDRKLVASSAWQCR